MPSRKKKPEPKGKPRATWPIRPSGAFVDGRPEYELEETPPAAEPEPETKES